MENMNRVAITLVAALLLVQGLDAQNLQKAGELYKKGFYAEALEEVERGDGKALQAGRVTKGDVEAIRTLALLQLKADGAEQKAEGFVKQFHEHIQVPQVRFLWAQNLFDRQEYEKAAEQLGAELQETHTP